jgi:2'-5' RNA ligase
MRRRSVGDASSGLPAHLTMLYPFVDPGRLRADVRRRLAAMAAMTPSFEYQLAGPASWPNATYVAVDPTAPFVALQGRLAEAFPAFPIYGTDPGFEFVPHVTIAEGPPAGDPAILDDPAWRSLPRTGRVASIEVIARLPGAPWRTIWRLPLDRMRP